MRIGALLKRCVCVEPKRLSSPQFSDPATSATVSLDDAPNQPSRLAAVTLLSFVPRASALVSVSSDSAVRVWELGRQSSSEQRRGWLPSSWSPFRVNALEHAPNSRCAQSACVPERLAVTRAAGANPNYLAVCAGTRSSTSASVMARCAS